MPCGSPKINLLVSTIIPINCLKMIAFNSITDEWFALFQKWDALASSEPVSNNLSQPTGFPGRLD
jgi:hypothetical protein